MALMRRSSLSKETSTAASSYSHPEVTERSVDFLVSHLVANRVATPA